jgi:hypothetical protein
MLGRGASHGRLTGHSPYTRRSLTVDNNVIYGEAPVGLRRCERVVGDTVLPIPPKTAKKLLSATKMALIAVGGHRGMKLRFGMGSRQEKATDDVIGH